MSVAVPSLPTVHDVKNKLRDVLNGGIKHDVEEHLMTVWDRGVFLNELHKQGIVLRTGINGAVDGRLAAKKGLTQGTYAGTRMALTEIYSLIEEAYGTPISDALVLFTNINVALRLTSTHEALTPSFPRREILNRSKMCTNGVTQPLMGSPLICRSFPLINKIQIFSIRLYLLSFPTSARYSRSRYQIVASLMVHHSKGQQLRIVNNIIMSTQVHKPISWTVRTLEMKWTGILTHDSLNNT